MRDLRDNNKDRVDLSEFVVDYEMLASLLPESKTVDLSRYASMFNKTFSNIYSNLLEETKLDLRESPLIDINSTNQKAKHTLEEAKEKLKDRHHIEEF